MKLLYFSKRDLFFKIFSALKRSRNHILHCSRALVAKSLKLPLSISLLFRFIYEKKYYFVIKKVFFALPQIFKCFPDHPLKNSIFHIIKQNYILKVCELTRQIHCLECVAHKTVLNMTNID